MHVGGPDGGWECNVRSVARFTVLVDPEAAAQSKMRKQLQQRRERKMECARLCSAAASRRACQGTVMSSIVTKTAASGRLAALTRGFASKATKGGATGAGPRKQGQQQGPDEANIGERRPEGFPKHVEVPEGGPTVSTPDYPSPLRNSIRDPEQAQDLHRNDWPRKN
eukprot:jgi/Astpho2/205/fgenesh1_pg.00010_%23_6_t